MRSWRRGHRPSGTRVVRGADDKGFKEPESVDCCQGVATTSTHPPEPWSGPSRLPVGPAQVRAVHAGPPSGHVTLPPRDVRIPAPEPGIDGRRSRHRRQPWCGVIAVRSRTWCRASRCGVRRAGLVAALVDTAGRHPRHWRPASPDRRPSSWGLIPTSTDLRPACVQRRRPIRALTAAVVRSAGSRILAMLLNAVNTTPNSSNQPGSHSAGCWWRVRRGWLAVRRG